MHFRNNQSLMSKAGCQIARYLIYRIYNLLKINILWRIYRFLAKTYRFVDGLTQWGNKCI